MATKLGGPMDQLVVFISYSQSDGRRWAIRLRDELRGMTPPMEAWIDLDRPRGYPFPPLLENAIGGCNVLLFVVTSGSLQSDWCQREFGYALRIGKRVLPLQMNEDVEPPWQLEGIPPVDFTKAWDDGWQELRKALALIDSPEARAESLEKERRILNGKAAKTSGVRRERYLREAAELGAKSEEERRRADHPEERRRRVTEEIRLGQAREQVSDAAIARLRTGNLNAASEAADAAARYRRGRRAPEALALQGITAFRKRQEDKARLAFLDARKKAEELREREGRSFQVLDVLGLVLCGLALSRELDGFDLAIGAYRKARRITREPGPVRRSLRLLDELSISREPEELTNVRRAAAGR